MLEGTTVTLQTKINPRMNKPQIFKFDRTDRSTRQIYHQPAAIIKEEQQIIMDIGESFLRQPISSIYEEPERPPSTGFLAYMKSLGGRNRIKTINASPQLVAVDAAPIPDATSVAFNTPVENLRDDGAASVDRVKIKMDDSSDVEEVEFVADISSAAEDDPADMSAISHSKIDTEYISFTNDENNNDISGIEGRLGDRRRSGRDRGADRSEPRKWNWKEGMSSAQLKHYYMDIVEDLVDIRTVPVWFGASSSSSTAGPPDESWYRGQSLPDVLEMEMRDVVAYLTPTAREKAVRRYCIKRIANVIYEMWPRASVYVFGSFQTQLYLPTSDIDMVVWTDDAVSGKNLLKPLRVVARNLVRKGRAVDIQVVPARIPIIKFTETFADFKVDISFNIDGGVHASRYITGLISEHSALRPLVMVMKQFLVTRDLNEVFKGGLGSFGLSAMITSFLQIHPRLQSGQIDEIENIGVLFLEFLDLYGRRFNYDHVGISLRNGGKYFVKGRLGNLNNTRPNSLTIEDPQDTDNDISKGSFNMRTVVNALSHAYNCLTSAIYEHADRQRKYKDIKVRSLMSTVLTVPVLTLEHRALVDHAYDKIPAEHQILDGVDFVDGYVPAQGEAGGLDEALVMQEQEADGSGVGSKTLVGTKRKHHETKTPAMKRSSSGGASKK
eukprot:Partr_v1_DN26966_c0_g1_i2_m7284 putative PAP associated domain containing